MAVNKKTQAAAQDNDGAAWKVEKGEFFECDETIPKIRRIPWGQ